MATDNKSLGRFHLDGIPPAPRGVPQIEVTFDIDANGILKVTAKDKATSRSQNITITGSSNLNKEEIERMKKEAEMHAQEDRKRRETVDARNQADTVISVSERTLKDAGDKAPEADRKAVQDKMDALKAVKDGQDTEVIKKAVDELSNAVQKVGAAMYQQQSAQQAQPNEQPQGADQAQPNAQGPVDAEYKDVSDKK
jgi:molecular chaperone DnaK